MVLAGLGTTVFRCGMLGPGIAKAAEQGTDVPIVVYSVSSAS